MNIANKPKEVKGRTAFKDVSNRFDAECSKHANVLKKRKVPASKLGNNTKKGLAASTKSCENKKSGAVIKKTPPEARSKSSQSKLPEPTKTASLTKITSKHGGSHALSSYQYSAPPNDIDKRDSEDPLCVTSYVQDMYTYFREQEHRAVVDPFALKEQDLITPRMRAILIDWLCEAHLKWKCLPESLYITVNIIDRYLSVVPATRGNLQLIGTSALLIATKYEEIYPIELHELVYVCDNTYSRDEILGMEETILKTLNYQISIPNAYRFLVRFLNAGHASRKMCLLASYVLEESLLSYDIIKKYTPSQLAAAAVLLARESAGRNAWSPTLLKFSDYREEDVVPVARDMIAAKSKLCPSLRALKKKYTSNKFGRVATCNFEATITKLSSNKE